MWAGISTGFAPVGVGVGGVVIRRILGLGALVALLGPVSCLTDEGPGQFSTAGTCYRGDVEGCTCTQKGHQGDPGVHTCGADLHFSTVCRCLGCTVFPDCSKCNDDCMEKCLCQTSGKTADCTALCKGDAGGSTTDSGASPQIR
jgi:hypothetical protein